MASARLFLLLFTCAAVLLLPSPTAAAAAAAAASAARDDASSSPPLFYSQCASRGFAAGATACDTCRLIAAALGSDAAQVSDCLSCCTPALDLVGAGGVPREFAAVSVSLCKASAGGGAKEWLEKSAAKWEKRGVDVVEPESCDLGGFGGFGGAFGGGAFGGMQQPTLGEGPAVVFKDDGDDDPIKVPIGSFKVEWIDALLKRHVGGE